MDDNIVFDYGKVKAFRKNYEVLRNDINTHLVFILVGQKAPESRIDQAGTARQIKGFIFNSPVDIS